MTSSTFFFFFVPLLAIILLAVNLIFAPHNPYQEKDSVFECGFHSFLGQNRTQFSISFFIFALLFLLFDLEILLVYPYVVSAHTNEIYGLVIMLIFFLALTLGFAFELGKNALKIDSRQMVALNKQTVSVLTSFGGLSKPTRYKISFKLFRRRVGMHTYYYRRTLITPVKRNPSKNNNLVLLGPQSSEDINKSFLIRGLIIPLTVDTLGRSVRSVRRKFTKVYPEAVRAEGNLIYLANGQCIFDASCGAAVSCLGHTNTRVAKAMYDINMQGLAYLSSSIFLTRHSEEFAKELLKDMDYLMAAVYLTGSGSEANEAMTKTVILYHVTLDPNTKRVKFIARENAYHGATTGSLALTQMGVRKDPFRSWLPKEVYTVSSCNPYHQLKQGESIKAFVERKRLELDAKFEELGPDTVAGFIVEPVVGAAMGAVPFVEGYLEAMMEVCHKHGALIMVDEVMCGMGRTGYLHAWQAEPGFVPDIQTVAKGLGGGFTSVSAVFWSQKVVDVMAKCDSKGFIHAQTFQGSPLQAVVASTVQKIIREKDLVANVRIRGKELMDKLILALDNHPNVGNIRGMGLFIGIEFVKDKITKQSFDPKLNIADRLATLGLSQPHNISVYPGSGGVDGVNGDHIIIAPAYNITPKDVDHIAKTVSNLIHCAFKNSTFFQRRSADLKSTFYSLNNKRIKYFLDQKKGKVCLPKNNHSNQQYRSIRGSK